MKDDSILMLGLVAVGVYFYYKSKAAPVRFVPPPTQNPLTCPGGEAVFTVYDPATDTFTQQCEPLPNG